MRRESWRGDISADYRAQITFTHETLRKPPSKSLYTLRDNVTVTEIKPWEVVVNISRPQDLVKLYLHVVLLVFVIPNLPFEETYGCGHRSSQI